MTQHAYWYKSGVYTFLQRFSTILFGFGGFYLLIRLLSREDFGIWSLFVSITALIEVARNGLIQNAQIKFASSASEEEYPKILKASLTLNILLTACSVVLLLGLAPVLSMVWKAPVLQPMFWLYTLTTICLIPFSQFNFIQQANLDFKGIFYSYLIRQGAFFLVILYFSLSHTPIDLLQLVIWMTVSAAVGSLISYFFVRKFFRVSARTDWKWVRKLFEYGKYVFGTNISSMLFSSIDQMMLGSLLSSSAVAVYNTAFKITNLIDVPISTVAAVVFPQSARRAETEGKPAIKYLYERSVGLMLAMIIPVVAVVLLLPSWIITLIAGDQYLDAIPVLQVTILYSLLQPFLRQFGTMMDSIGKPNVNFYVLALVALINIASNFLFIHFFGLMGAAYGTLFSLVAALFINQLILQKELDVQLRNVFTYTVKFYRDFPQMIRFSPKKALVK